VALTENITLNIKKWHEILQMFFSNFGDVNLRQVNASTTLFARAVGVNTLAQGSLR